MLGVHDHGLDSLTKQPWQASIRLVGVIKQRTTWVHPGSFQNHLTHRNWFDMRHRDDTRQTVRTFTYLLLGYRIMRLENFAAELIDLKGLLVEPVAGCKSTYRRTGVFHHDWKHARDDSGQFPPFVDFDPKKVVAEPVTLI